MQCLWLATSGPLTFTTNCYLKFSGSYWSVMPLLFQDFLENRGSMRQYPSSCRRMPRRAARTALLFCPCAAPACLCPFWRGLFAPGRGPVRCALFPVAAVPRASLGLFLASLASTLLSSTHYCAGHSCGRSRHGRQSCCNI
jgi:hypothetical protein